MFVKFSQNFSKNGKLFRICKRAKIFLIFGQMSLNCRSDSSQIGISKIFLVFHKMESTTVLEGNSRIYLVNEIERKLLNNSDIKIMPLVIGIGIFQNLNGAVIYSHPTTRLSNFCKNRLNPKHGKSNVLFWGVSF